jgi:hypothetical protein
MNRLKEILMNDDLDIMSKIEKEALCYRLLVARDKINDDLRRVQESLKGDV